MFVKEITAIGNAIGLEGKFMVDFGFDQIMAILKPEPEMEEVEVEQYTVITPNGGCLGTYPTPEAAGKVMHDKFQLVVMRGAYRRPKNQPVMQIASVDAYVDFLGKICANERDGRSPLWSEHDTHDKRGTLTFSYPKEP